MVKSSSKLRTSYQCLHNTAAGGLLSTMLVYIEIIHLVLLIDDTSDELESIFMESSLWVDLT